MNDDRSDVVLMFVDSFDFFRGVIVVYSNHVVVGSHYNHLLAGDEFCATHGRVCNIERAHLCLRVVVINHDCATIEGNENPGQRSVQVNALDPV